MHYQLFFPKRTSNAAACLRDAGLPDFVEGASECPTIVEGQSGLLVGWSKSVGYDASRQRWIDAGEYRVGFWIDSPCVPDELSRRQRFAGFSIPLADGTCWTVPVASELPSTLRLIDGHWNKVRKPAFDEYWRRSEVWFRRFVLWNLDEKRMLDDAKIEKAALIDEWVDFCVFTLRQNYRITPLIASELGLIDDDAMLRVTIAAVDGISIGSVYGELSHEMEREAAGLPKKDDDPKIPDS